MCPSLSCELLPCPLRLPSLISVPGLRGRGGGGLLHSGGGKGPSAGAWPDVE